MKAVGCQVYEMKTILLSVHRVFRNWTMRPLRILAINISANTRNKQESSLAYKYLMNRIS